MKSRKLLLTVLCFSFLQFGVYAQETEDGVEFLENPVAEIPATDEATATDDVTTTDEATPAEELSSVEEEIVNIQGKEFEQAENFVEFIRSLDFMLNIGPACYLNTESKTRNAENLLISAPSPLVSPVSIGILWPNYTFVAVEPRVSFYRMYYLWYENRPLPAEIENRTVFALSFMIDLPIVFSLYMKTNRIQLSAGPSVLVRAFSVPTGVANNGDTALAKDYFWAKNRFLYASLGASWLFNASGNLKFGPEVKAYIPVGGLLNKEGLQGALFLAGFKISL